MQAKPLTIAKRLNKIFNMLEICKLGDEVLREECVDIKKFDSALKMLTEAMVETLVSADGVGLAAPQVGINQKLFVVKLPDKDPQVFINPEIIETSVETGPYEEGCLSLPGLYHEVIRPLGVTIQAQDVKGKPFTIKADGLLARVIQHENDHLHGKLYIDHLEPKEKEKMIKLFEKKNSKKRHFRKV